MTKKLEKEFNYYLDNQSDLLKKYEGKFLVIKGAEVIGTYDTELESLEETVKEHKLGTFLIQHCTPGADNYTQTYHSRVAFG
ncbi:MAG: hypothetical protein U9R05_10790 [Chloroflexota bacterium]|nr:hypothetical protein [Chloroflexota bacterium]